MGIDIYFIDQNNGWAVGNYWMPDTNGAGILGTKDGGGSWELFWKYPNSENISNNLNSITYSGTSCWSVGEGGMIVQYTPKTGRVRQTTVTDLPLNKVFFSDRNNGWIAGGYQNKHGFQTILLKTTNSGANWNIVTNVPYLFRDIWFIDNNHGWAIGYDINRRGGILKTTDGGDNWFVDTSNLPAQLNSLFIKDNYGWAVGYNGLILRNTDAGTVWVKDENNIYPTEFRLEQNYPNPFNPSTKIRYSIPQSSKVVIKLFDILGNEIETLINEEKPAGTYAVEFDAITLPSGVYFYQLRAGNFVETKKMLLLK